MALAVAACGGSARDKDGEAGDSAEPELEVEVQDTPTPERRYDGGHIIGLVDAGVLSEGEAALALWQLYYGYLDRIDPALLQESSAAPADEPVPAHLFLGSVVSRLSELPEDEARAIEDLHREVFGDGGDSPPPDDGEDDGEEDLLPVQDWSWCTEGLSSDSCVRVWLQLRPPCQRENGGGFVLDASGFPVPEGCSPYLGAVYPPAVNMDCAEVLRTWDPAKILRSNVAAMRSEVWAAVEAASPTFQDKLGLQCESGHTQAFAFDSSPANWGSSIGVANERTSGRCYYGFSTSPPSAAEAGFLSTTDLVRTTVVHETFHCAQQQSGQPLVPNWIIEGTATWAEDVIGDAVWPGMNGEHGVLQGFYTPAPFLDRLYSAGTGMVMLREQAPDLGYEVVLAQGAEAQTLAALPDFDRLWHEASLATWNRSPVEIWDNDGQAMTRSSRPEEPSALAADTTVDLAFAEVPALSYATAAYEPEPDVETILVALDFPDGVSVSGILEGGPDPRVEDAEPGEPLTICNKAVGVCHERTEDELDEVVVFGLVATNALPDQAQVVSGSLRTNPPALHGRWRTTRMWTSANPTMVVQSGGILSIDEEADGDTFSEALSGVGVYDLPTCTTTGSVAGEVSSTYSAVGAAEAVSGTLSTTTLTGGSTAECFDESGTFAFSGATPGVWIMAASGSPWAPVTFDVTKDTLSLTSNAASGVQWFMTLERISDTP